MKLRIVEDDRKTAGFLHKAFEEEGFAVRVARDGAEGLASAVAEPPDLAVVDVMLPAMSRLEWCAPCAGGASPSPSSS